MSAELAACHHTPANGWIVTSLGALVVLAVGFVCASMTGYSQLLVRVLEVQSCCAGPVRGERLLFFLPLF
jgi:hypothetical protein